MSRPEVLLGPGGTTLRPLAAGLGASTLEEAPGSGQDHEDVELVVGAAGGAGSDLDVCGRGFIRYQRRRRRRRTGRGQSRRGPDRGPPTAARSTGGGHKGAGRGGEHHTDPCRPAAARHQLGQDMGGRSTHLRPGKVLIIHSIPHLGNTAHKDICKPILIGQLQ